MAMQKKNTASLELPWKVKLYMSAVSFSFNVSLRRNITVNRFLFNLFDQKSAASNDISVNGVKSRDVTVDHTHNLWFRIFTPTNTTSEGEDTRLTLPVIVYFHGGGFVLFGADSKLFHDLCERLARELPAVIISVNYRLSPEHRCPSQYEDGISVLKFIDNLNSENFPANANLNHLFLAGDSAGGNLIHHVGVQLHTYKFKRVKLTGIIGIGPFFGGEERTESEKQLVGVPVLSTDITDWFWKAFLPEGSDRDHPAVNVYGPDSADITGIDLPATMVVVGGFDILKDSGKRYHEWLKKCEKEAYLIEYPNAPHAFYVFPELVESSLLMKDVRDFIQTQCAKNTNA